ncbi:MAG: DUF1223 domain-containing protein [Bacteroidia bacterium]|jgi:hypothetical protein
MIRNFLTVITFSLALFSGHSHGQGPAQTPGTPSVLLELFSSEGCSSCPEADAFAYEILRLSDSTHSPVFVIDYHVDIWNRSGWVDSFSTPEFTQRQTDYMKKVKQEAMFTPMMFVNGQYGMPAGAKKEIGQAIYKELVTAAKCNLTINAALLSDGKGLNISYNLSSMMDSLQLVLVLAEREVTSKVTAGENAGKMLIHHNIARRLLSVPIKNQSGTYNFPLGDFVNLEKYILVGFLQQVNSWKVYSTDMIYFKR